MKFNENQEKVICEFIIKYNTNEQFRNNVQNLYNNEIHKLSILEIYALEEILRYGTKQVFNKFIAAKGICDDKQAVDLFDGFIKLLNEDSSFKQFKTEQLKNSPETLSSIETFAFSLLNDFAEEKNEQKNNELKYDPLNPILYSTDGQIRQTLESLFFGEFIHKLLELPTMKDIKNRQKEKGVIASIDKPFIIKKIQEILSDEKNMSQLQNKIDSRFVKVKMNILLGQGKDAFNEFLQYNTNISSNEILGTKKANEEEEIYNFFTDILNKRKNQDKKK